MRKRGTLIVISGFSGVGKGTAAKRLVEKYNYSLSVSATTRKPRPGEVDGREYYFKTVDEFRNLIDYNGFIEYTQYVENYYGTPRAFVEKELEEGRDVILEIEVEGALNIIRQYPEAILVFVTAESAQSLVTRLTNRHTEDEATIRKRMKRAREEADSIENYEYIVVNKENCLEECVDAIHSIVVSKKLELQNWYSYIENMKDELQKL